MKKLLLLSMAMVLFAGCSKDPTSEPVRPDAGGERSVPHFYGCAMLDTSSPSTRGVANKTKVWPTTMVATDLTVKFLNGTTENRKFVEEVAKEWEKAAGIRFFFVRDDQEALIRIGFDYVRGMRTSWSYTGMDILDLLDNQDEPTIHFADWRRIPDAKKRSDVLRAFGQTLGLELEYRHPMLDPGWIRNEDGTVNEEEIRLYWEDELAEFITWEELKKMVLDPLSVNARFIAKTDYYDQESVMNWPFFDEIAHSQRPIERDSDYKTELSENDKEFIKSLYGESFNGIPDEDNYFPLIEFNHTGTTIQFNVTTSKRLVVIWDEDAKECSYVDLPTDTTTMYSKTVSHTFAESKKRKVIIGEMLEYGQAMPESSTALKKFSFTGAVGAEDIKVELYNLALEDISINGGKDFIPQYLTFASNNNVKTLHVMQTLGSFVNLDNCQNLEVLATTPTIYKPKTYQTLPTVDVGIIGDQDWKNEFWPYKPMATYSLGDSSGKGFDIRNCNNLNTICIDNTQIKEVEFGENKKLQYIYFSSQPLYLVGGGNPRGKYLLDMVNKLPSRKGQTQGVIALRGIEVTKKLFDETSNTLEAQDLIPVVNELRYAEVLIDRITLGSIERVATAKNWKIIWDSGVYIR